MYIHIRVRCFPGLPVLRLRATRNKGHWRTTGAATATAAVAAAAAEKQQITPTVRPLILYASQQNAACTHTRVENVRGVKLIASAALCREGEWGND